MISPLHPKRFETSFFPKFFFLLRTDSSRIHRIRFYPFEDKRNFRNLKMYNERSYWIISSIIDIKLSIHHCGIVAWIFAEIVIDFCVIETTISRSTMFFDCGEEIFSISCFLLWWRKMLKFRVAQRGKKSFSRQELLLFVRYPFHHPPSENETRPSWIFNVRNVTNYRELRQVEEGRLNFV